MISFNESVFFNSGHLSTPINQNSGYHKKSYEHKNNCEEIDCGEVDDVMKYMDATYSTKFCENVHNESNVEQIATNLKSVVDEYEISRVIKGVQWIIPGWSLQSIVHLILVIRKAGLWRSLPS
eukprot:Awhi_evm1s3279